jgi:hypothetical protein
VRWPAIQAPLHARFEFEPELRRDHHLIAERCKSFAGEFFVGERAVGFGGVEECNTAFDGARYGWPNSTHDAEGS